MLEDEKKMSLYDQIPVYSQASPPGFLSKIFRLNRKERIPTSTPSKCIVTQLDNKTVLVAGTSTANSRGIAEILVPITVSPSATISYSISCIGTYSRAFVEKELVESYFAISSVADQRLSWQLYISNE